LPSLRIAGAIRFDPQDLVGGGDRKEKQVNKACALSVLQPPLLSNWNKWNTASARPPWAHSTRLQRLSPLLLTTNNSNRVAASALRSKLTPIC
jgi:hypothetical protein